MKNAIQRKNLFVAVIVALLIAVSGALLFTPAAYAEEETTASLMFGNAEKTVVTGVSVEGEGEFSLDIPATVTVIADYAFTGKSKLTTVTFAAGSALASIGKFAFAGTGITAIELPESLTDIAEAAFAETALVSAVLPDGLQSVGNGAFGNCPNLTSITMPAYKQPYTSFGSFAVDTTVKAILKNPDEFKKFQSIDFNEAGILPTYTVTIRYSVMGEIVDTETRLAKSDYTFVQKDGNWVSDPNEKLGTVATQNVKAWYKSAEDAAAHVDGTQLDEAGVTELLHDCYVNGKTEITLYAAALGEGEKLFVARNDLIYNENASYDKNSYNALLAGVSDRITSGMTTEITAYTTPDGAAADIPSVIHHAGAYTIQVDDGGKTYVFTVRIAPKALNLADYNNSLGWRMIDGDTAVELRDSDGILLYVYAIKTGGEYPSFDLLDAEDIDRLNLTGSYEKRTVRYSVVRNRGKEVTIELRGNTSAYTATYAGNKGTDVGAYTAIAQLTAMPDYTLTVDSNRTDTAARGLTITVGVDGKTATVQKVWYIAEIGNWLIEGNGSTNEYTIANRTFGDTTPIAAPSLMYGSAAENLTFLLTYNKTTVGEEFSTEDFGKYLNKAMPAGAYTLKVTAKGVEVEEPIDPANPNGETVRVYHNGFTRDINFTVNKSTLPADAVSAIHAALKEKSFVYEWDAGSHFYDTETQVILDEVLQNAEVVPSRENTEWAKEEYNGYYGAMQIDFNLLRSQSDAYYPVGNVAVSTDAADRYTVNYRITAPGYFSSIENLPEGESRTDYRFYVVNVRAVEMPHIDAKTYNGKVQKADIADGQFYTVATNDGGMSVGAYDVVLSLREPEFYMWKGQTLDTKTATVTLKFNVMQASNVWDVLPDITLASTGEAARWVYGEYNPAENLIVGSPLFGTVHIVITDSDDKVVYDSADGTNKLAKAKPGVYNLSATVEGTDDYTALSYAIFVRVFEKAGLPWWAGLIIGIGALLVAAAVILILWKKGVFQLLTGKVILAIRAKATVDATIAAVRANKVAEASRASIAEAEAQDRAQARREAAQAEKLKPVEEKAAALEAKAKATAERAEQMRARSDAMLEKAERMKANNKTAPESEDQAAQEAAATENETKE